MNVLGILWQCTLFLPPPRAVVSQFTSLGFHLENKLKIKFDNCLTLIKSDLESHFFSPSTAVLSFAGICSLDLVHMKMCC